MNDTTESIETVTSDRDESYEAFILAKVAEAPAVGFEPPLPLTDSLFPHQRDIVRWACLRGRAAIFASFGLGKTRMQLEIARQTVAHATIETDAAEVQNEMFLIVAPLAMRGEFRREGEAMGMSPLFVRTDAEVDAAAIFQRFAAWSSLEVYDYENHVELCEALDTAGKLPPSFMLLQPQSHSDAVWADVTRMRTLNTLQAAADRVKHLCPLPTDIADRIVERFTNPGEIVFDPFGGLGTVPLRAMRLGRKGLGTELNPVYWREAVRYLRAEERAMATPTLFDLDAVARIVEAPQPQTATVADRPGVVRALPQESQAAAEAPQEKPAKEPKAPRKPRSPKEPKEPKPAKPARGTTAVFIPGEPMLLVDDAAKAGAA